MEWIHIDVREWSMEKRHINDAQDVGSQLLAAFFRAFMAAFVPARKMMDPRSASKSVSTDLEISSMEFHSGLDGPRGEMVRELTRADS